MTAKGMLSRYRTSPPRIEDPAVRRLRLGLVRLLGKKFSLAAALRSSAGRTHRTNQCGAALRAAMGDVFKITGYKTVCEPSRLDACK
jgi:hypothetical protein